MATLRSIMRKKNSTSIVPATPATPASCGVDVVRVVVMALVLLFSVYPVILMMAQSAQGGVEATLARYQQVIVANGQALLNSAFVGVLAAALACVVGLATALCQVFGPKRLRTLLRVLTLITMVSPPFIASTAYIQLFGRRGIITHSLLGITASPYGWQGIVLMQGLFFSSLNVLMLMATLERLDASVIKAAQDAGAKPGRIVRSIILPLVTPTLIACFLLTFIRSISDYGTPLVMGGSFETISTQIYMQLIGYSNLPAVAVLDVLLLVLAALVFYARSRLDAKTQRLVTAQQAQSVPAGEVYRLGGALGAAVVAVAVLFAAVMLVLYATMVRTAFVSGMGLNAPFTWAHIQHLVSFNLTGLYRSLLFSACSAVLACVLGALIAYFCQRLAMRGRALFDFAVSLPYLLPGTCVGLGYILAFNQAPLKLTGTAFILVVVIAFKELSVAVATYRASMEQVPRALDRAAQSLGASPVRTFIEVIWPCVREATRTTLINGFSSAMCAYSAVIFLIGPGNKTAIFELFDALSGGKYGEAAAISLVLIGVTAGINIAADAFARRAPQRRARKAAAAATAEKHREVGGAL
jgi:iron(III) transport system permease protein